MATNQPAHLKSDIPAAPRFFVQALILNNNRFITNKNLTKEEYQTLQDMTMSKVQTSRSDGLEPSDYQATPYDMTSPVKTLTDVDTNLVHSFNRMAFVRHNGHLWLADEYDFPEAADTDKMSFMEKVQYVWDQSSVESKGSDTGPTHATPAPPEKFLTAFALKTLSMFGPRPGEGPSARIDLGRLEDFNVDPSTIQMLADYEQAKIQKGQMNPANMMTQGSPSGSPSSSSMGYGARRDLKGVHEEAEKLFRLHEAVNKMQNMVE